MPAGLDFIWPYREHTPVLRHSVNLPETDPIIPK